MKKLIAMLIACMVLLLAGQTALALDTEAYTLHGDVRIHMSFDEVAAIERALLQDYQEYPNGSNAFYAPGAYYPVKISGVTTIAGYPDTQVAFYFGDAGKGGLEQMAFVFLSGYNCYDEIELGLTAKYGPTLYTEETGLAPKEFHLIGRYHFMEAKDLTRYSYRVIPWEGISKMEIQHVEFPGQFKVPVHVLLYRITNPMKVSDYKYIDAPGDL